MRTYSDRFHVGAPTQAGPLTVFPVWTETLCTREFSVLNQEHLSLAELATPQVGEVRLGNRGQIPMLIPEGTIFGGGWQTRVAVADRYLLAGEETDLSVNCVERGRWQGEARHEIDGRAPISVVASLRGIRPAGREMRDQQSEVWEKVSRLERHYGQRQTNSLRDIMADETLNERPERAGGARAARQGHGVDPDVLETVNRLASRRLPGQSGVLIGVGGHPASLELFGHPRFLRQQIANLLRAALLDASIVDFEPTTGRRARAFAEEIMYTPLNLTAAQSKSLAFSGKSSLVDVRTLTAANLNTGAFHLAVINRKHELALAA